MPDPAMQPEPEPEKVETFESAGEDTVTATLTWTSTGVSIWMPDLNGGGPESVTWDGSSLTKNTAHRWESSTMRETNTLAAVYGGSTYANNSIPRNATSAVLTKR
jgi:hypothetical protein